MLLQTRVQTAEPETALERALLDREEALRRAEADLQRERTERHSRVAGLQKKLEQALEVLLPLPAPCLAPQESPCISLPRAYCCCIAAHFSHHIADV